MCARVYVFQDASESELENMLCDDFDVTLSDMQVLIADKGNLHGNIIYNSNI